MTEQKLTNASEDLAGRAQPSADAADKRGPSWRERLPSPGTIICGLILAAIFLAAVFPGLFTSYDPYLGTPTDRLLPPSPDHWFGTDSIGRDLFSRTVYGASLSVGTAVLAVALAMVAGVLLGLLAGYVGGAIDSALMRFMDVLLSIPSLLLSLSIVTALGFSPIAVAAAVGIPNIGGFARTMRSEVIRVKKNEYVEAATASGVRTIGVLARHVLPNSLTPIAGYAVLEFGYAILAIAALSFLGFGAQPPNPEWGALIAGGRSHLATAWWLTTLPGVVLIATVISANRLAHGWQGADK